METMNYVSAYKNINRCRGTNNVKTASRKDENGDSYKTRTCDKLSNLIKSENPKVKEVGIKIIKGLIDFKQARNDSWLCAGKTKQNVFLDTVNQGLKDLRALSQQDIFNLENSALPNLDLTELEILVKNSSLFVQRDIPTTFKDFLKGLSKTNPHIMKEIITDENSGFLRKNGITLENNKANTKTIQDRQQDNVHFYSQDRLGEPKPFIRKKDFYEKLMTDFSTNKTIRLTQDDDPAIDQVKKDFFRTFNTDPRAAKLNINGEYVNLDVDFIEKSEANDTNIYQVLDADKNLHKFLEAKNLINEKPKIICMIMFSSNQMLMRSGLLSPESLFDSLRAYMPGTEIRSNININTKENTIEYKYEYKLASIDKEEAAPISCKTKHSINLNSQQFNGDKDQFFNQKNRDLITDIRFTSVKFNGKNVSNTSLYQRMI
jgi:hypothetical protein